MAAENGEPQIPTIVDTLAARAAAEAAAVHYAMTLSSQDDLGTKEVQTLQQKFLVQPVKGNNTELVAQRMLWDAEGDESIVLCERPVTRSEPFSAVSFSHDDTPNSPNYGGQYEFQGESTPPDGADPEFQLNFWRLVIPTNQFTTIEIIESRHGELLPLKWLGGQVVPVTAEDRVAIS